MRRRFALLASALIAVVVVAVPGVANAAPRHNHGLTINASPNPIITGDNVLIYGRLTGAHSAHTTILLYHRINPGPAFTLVGRTTTNGIGFYEFKRAEDVVLSNREWFARAAGLPGVHSRTVRERVAAALSITPTSPTGDTGHPITITGHVDPAGLHVGEPVFLQRETASGNWRTVTSGSIDRNSNYSISRLLRTPGTYSFRVLFRGDARNIGAVSDTAVVDIAQLQDPRFTIHTSDPLITTGRSATISGVLSLPGMPSLVGEPNVNVTLFARQLGQSRVTARGTTTTGKDGSYSFKVAPQHNTEYFVRTTFRPIRRTAEVFVGVQSAVTLASNSPTAVVGQTVTFTGTVAPDKAGDVVSLQRLGRDGAFHTVAAARINFASAYRLIWRFGNSGTFTFRTRVVGDGTNVGGASPPVTVTVSLPAVSSLPPAR